MAAVKVLHVIRSCDPRGGGPIEAIRQLAAAADPDWSFSVISVDAPSADWAGRLGLPVTAAGPAYTRYAYAPGFARAFREAVGTCDAVVIHGLWLYPDHAAARIAARRGVPYLVYVHGMLDPAFRALFPGRHVCKAVSWRLFDRRMLERAGAVLFTCEEERRLAPQSFGAFRARAEIVPYAVGEPPGDAGRQREAFLQAFAACRGKRLVLFLSRLHPKKGCDILLEAFARALGPDPRFHLVMAGPDSAGWRGDLEAAARRLGLADRVTWTGMLEGDLKWGAFRAAEVFALPSHQENYGIAVVEALACSVPVLITRRVNIWKEVETDGAGLIGEDRAESFTTLLEQWARLSEEDRVAYRRAARRCFVTRFDARAAAGRFAEVVWDVVSGKSGP